MKKKKMKQIRLLVSRAMNFPLFPASLVLLDCRGTAKTTRPDSSLLSDLCGKKWIGKYTLRPMGISHGTCFCFSRDCLGKKTMAVSIKHVLESKPFF